MWIRIRSFSFELPHESNAASANPSSAASFELYPFTTFLINKLKLLYMVFKKCSMAFISSVKPSFGYLSIN